MINPDNITKRYYKIGEVAAMFDVSTSLIRYWESEFEQLKPMKSKSGIRRYQKEDILLIDRIYELVKVRAYTLDGAKKALHSGEASTERKEKRHLKQIKAELESLRRSLVELKSEIRPLQG